MNQASSIVHRSFADSNARFFFFYQLARTSYPNHCQCGAVHVLAGSIIVVTCRGILIRLTEPREFILRGFFLLTFERNG